jgi:hypothetical protein
MLLSALGKGLIAGAAGTTALNAATYADMALRGRPASTAPEQTVDTLAQQAGHPVPGAGETRENRLTGLGSLSGIATGVGVGAAAGLLHPVLTRLPMLLSAALVGGGVMAATDLSMVKLGVTDPSSWSAADWASDAAPHLVFGAVTVGTLRLLGRSEHRAADRAAGRAARKAAKSAARQAKKQS